MKQSVLHEHSLGLAANPAVIAGLEKQDYMKHVSYLQCLYVFPYLFL